MNPMLVLNALRALLFKKLRIGSELAINRKNMKKHIAIGTFL